ncbi:relaxase/mobilization nuclease domain-containing protein [Shewanella algae]|nr:relaxase/mobilization nuclease domain-containing protein [Shewanella algae]
MIAKHVPMRSQGKSDFAGLVNYITDHQSKEHRLGSVRLNNCEAETVRDAISEVLATQFANTRAKSDKTYHLIVSFPSGEQLEANTLAAIEERICQGLGYGEHQRVSAVHNDTDNQHIHIAINKIHPTRNTIHEPYYPHKKLAEICEAIEQDFGLQPDNHIPRKRGAESRAMDMERHSGIESLVGWVKRECMDEIKSANNWQALHQVMQDNGLQLRTRGNGLVIVADGEAIIKASTLGRDFSKSKLEARLGPFEAAASSLVKPSRQYIHRPVRLKVNTTELYARYQAQQKYAAASKSQALEQARREKNRQVENAKRNGHGRRAAIKLAGSNRLVKKVLYKQASNALKADLEHIQKRYRELRQTIYQNNQRQTWADWLKSQALQGDSDALNALRNREATQKLKGNTLKGDAVQAEPKATIDTITKKGTIIYRVGNSAVRDDGERLQVATASNQTSVLAALKVAMDRYGNRITVNGSPEFKARVIKAAVDGNLSIKFADQRLERRRQALVAQNKGSKGSDKPDVLSIGKVPPSRRGRLLNLSQLEVLAIQSGPVTQKASVEPALEQRKAKLQAEQAAKKAKRKQKSRSR